MEEEKKLTAETTQYISSARGCCVSNDPDQTLSAVNQMKCCKLSSYNWLGDITDPSAIGQTGVVEVRFKNGRKDFYTYPGDMTLKEGELVAVEASPGHDIGIVSLTGELVHLQMKRKGVDPEKKELHRVFRHARTLDIEKWLDAIKREDSTMYKTRVIALDIGLAMKINDVEYQGDKTKAIFYYTADERVDFRELIKKLAEAFHIRIEMRQIGVRQEAAKLGGIGSCGRELCCASWMSSFQSVSTNSARIQQLSLNPQKLAGQCGKLKCCLNHELDNYIDTLQNFPDNRIKLKTKKGKAFYVKSDVLKNLMWYAYMDDSNNMMAIPVDKVKEIIELNSKGKFPAELELYAHQKEQKSNVESGTEDDLAQYI
jgi:cell fate regulator YaaT (PSP1 superfamily)